MGPYYPYSHEILMTSLVDSRPQAGSHLQWQAATSILEASTIYIHSELRHLASSALILTGYAQQERQNASLNISSMGYYPYAPPHLLNYVVPPGLGHQSHSVSQVTNVFAFPIF